MSLCKKCKDKICLETGKPCPEAEKVLTQMTVGKLPHTISLDGNYFERVITETDRGYKFIREGQD